jgi:hypothetical protein
MIEKSDVFVSIDGVKAVVKQRLLASYERG